MKKQKRSIQDIGRRLANGSRLRGALDLVRGFLALEQLLQGATLIAVGLLVIFAGAFTQTVAGVLLMVYGGYLIIGGRL